MAGEGELNVTVKASLPSVVKSAVIGTESVLLVSPTLKVSKPELAPV